MDVTFWWQGRPSIYGLSLVADCCKIHKPVQWRFYTSWSDPHSIQTFIFHSTIFPPCAEWTNYLYILGVFNDQFIYSLRVSVLPAFCFCYCCERPVRWSVKRKKGRTIIYCKYLLKGVLLCTKNFVVWVGSKWRILNEKVLHPNFVVFSL